MAMRYDSDTGNYVEDYEEQPYEPPPIHPGANTGSGPWAPGYDPGANFDAGPSGDPYSQYNAGSPVDAPLAPGTGWEWSGPQEPRWNMATNEWDQGSWNQVEGRGLGYTAPTAPSGGGGGGGGRGAVAPIRSGGGGGGISVPGATLPGHILDLFNQKPEITPIQKAYQDALLSFMDRSAQTPSLSDSTLAPQVEVFRAANQRNTERQRRSAVERAGTGQSQSGYLDNLINEGVQKQGFGNASFNANLLGGELDKRRQALLSGLQLAQATGNSEAQRELQARLAQVSAAMQQQGLNLQGQLGQADLGLRYDQLGANTMLGLEGLNQQALQMLLGGL